MNTKVCHVVARYLSTSAYVDSTIMGKSDVGPTRDTWQPLVGATSIYDSYIGDKLQLTVNTRQLET
jgi:hypothetical protein